MAVLGAFRAEYESLRDQASGAVGTDEPAALDYVFNTLLDEDLDDPVEMKADQFWHLLAVLKTVVETLHEVSEVRR